VKGKLLISFFAFLICFFQPLCYAQEGAPQRTQPVQQRVTPAPRGGAKPRVEKTREVDPLTSLEGLERPSLVVQGAALVFMSLLPFLVMILSSFVKIVIVLSLLRNALGVQQAPPNQVINGIAFLLSIYVMFPTGVKMYDATKEMVRSKDVPKELVSADSAEYIIALASKAREPLRDFLKNNSLVRHQRTFFKSVYKVLPEEYRDDLKTDDFLVLVPSFIASQLKSAFEIGVLIYIPFFVIDLVVSNILLAMGMMMLSPVTISMPLKLFLLVMLDGWTLLIEGLVSTFK
jgi:type III secretion protein R